MYCVCEPKFSGLVFSIAIVDGAQFLSILGCKRVVRIS